MKLKKSVKKFFKKVQLIILKNMFSRIKDKEENLSSSEYFCLECIYLMNNPTISQFASFMDISSPNATYKVKQLIKKGFITKEKSPTDGREYLLVPTPKFYDFYQNKEDYVLINDLKEQLGKKDAKKIDKIMKILTEQMEA
ncbi:MAG: MarR family transcriptional regulator [Clostridiales bacterium]|nr:MarR family transcriptional regulator [Clostridiales bacterium]